MKLQVLLPLSIALSVASFALMKLRVKDLLEEEKRNNFLDVKLRVTNEMLMEYDKDKVHLEKSMDTDKAEQEALQKAISEIGADAKKGELDACTGAKKTITDETESLQKQYNTYQADSTKEKTAWEAEIAALKEKLSATSPICKYLKPGSTVQGCPEPPKAPEVKKEEPPKPEEKKEEPPKQEEKKEEPPKPEEKKEEPPKPEEKKEEPPKPEEKKEEPPKPEQPKQ